MALEKPGKLGFFFSYFVATLIVAGLGVHLLHTYVWVCVSTVKEKLRDISSANLGG